MRKMIVAVVIIGLALMGCATTDRYNTQRGAAIGAGLGALAGQAIGHNTTSTLIGTGVGTLLGTIIGNGVDQQADEYRSRDELYRPRSNYNSERRHSRNYYEEPLASRQPPPGRWVMVTGHWEGREWVPAHEVWMPIDPRY